MGNEQSGESRNNNTNNEQSDHNGSWTTLSPTQRRERVIPLIRDISPVPFESSDDDVKMNTPAKRNEVGQGAGGSRMEQEGSKKMKLPGQTPNTVVDSDSEDSSDESMDQIRAIAMATAKRRLSAANQAQKTSPPKSVATKPRPSGAASGTDSDSDLSDAGAKIRAIAQQTANRRLMMAQAMGSNDNAVDNPAPQDHNTVRLQGYTGPDALARENEKMERIRLKAMKSVSRELGTGFQETSARQLATSDAGSESSSSQDDDSSAMSEEYSQGATNFHDIEDPQLKRLASKLLKKLNHDPWDEFKKYSDPDVCEFIERHPETASILYDFTHFSGYIFPLSMLCTLGASPQTIEQAYKAYKPAIDECDVWIGTPLHYACSYKAKSNVVSLLISKQPSMLQKTNQFGRTPLHTACLFKGSTKMVSVLLQKFPRAAVVPEKDGYTPLHLACENGANSEVVKMLANSNPETCLAKTKKGSTALDLAYMHNANKIVVETLVQTCMVLAEKDHELNSSREDMNGEESKPVASVGVEDSQDIRNIARATQERRLRAAEAIKATRSDVSDEGADIRAIAQETARRRLEMADQANYGNMGRQTEDTAAALPGYTGPDALAKQHSMMEKLKAKAIASAGRELGANTRELATSVGVSIPMEHQNLYDGEVSDDSSGSDYGSDSDFSSEEDTEGEEESGSEEQSEAGFDVRAIARQTEQRRLQMAMSMRPASDIVPNQTSSMVDASAVRLEGYTGPDALARETSKMDKIKAKAIQSASRQLGTCSTALEKAVGVNATAGNTAVQEMPPTQSADLAGALGMSAAFFQKPRSVEARARADSDKKKKSLFDNVLVRLADGTQPTAHDDGNDGPRGESSPNKFSLAEALGMQVDPSNSAPPVPQSVNGTTRSFMEAVMARASNPDEYESESENSSTQYTDESDPASRPQANSLAMALGMKIDHSGPAIQKPGGNGIPKGAAGSKKSFMDAIMARASTYDSESEDSSTQYTDESDPASRPQANSLAMALGMRVDSSNDAPAIREPRSNAIPTRAMPPSAAGSKKSFMDAIMARASTYDSESEDSSTQYTDESDPASRPQANSLAMALGMRVAPSNGAPAMREMASGSDPQANSLAMALGMKVDSSSNAPSIRKSGDDTRAPSFSASKSKKSFAAAYEPEPEDSTAWYSQESNAASRPQANSLAMALGMRVDPNMNALPVRESSSKRMPYQAAPPSAASNKKSFMQMVMARTATQAESGSESYESSTHNTDDTNPALRPQANSLAMALGMKIDNSTTAPPIRDPCSGSTAIPPSACSSKKNFMNAIMARAAIDVDSDSESEDSSTQYTDETNPASRPQANSLAMALGMRVDNNTAAPAIREAGGNSIPNNRAAPPSAPSNKKSFMDAIIARASAFESESEDSSTQYTDESDPASRPQANSLAMALGMRVASSNGAPAIRETGVNAIPTRAMPPSAAGNKKSFMQMVMAKAATQADSDSESEDSSTQYTDESDPASRPQANSLAMALGMRVASSTGAPAIRETGVNAIPTRAMPPSAAGNKKSFMQMVMAKAATQADSDSESEDSSTQYTDESDPASRPQANSLAMALGMRVDSSNDAPAIREPRSNGIPTRAMPTSAAGNKKSFMETIMARASAYDSESEDSSTQFTDESDPASRPQANSLAMALGMKIDSSNRAPAIRASRAAAQHTNPCVPVQNKKSFMSTVLLRAQGENDSDSSGTEVTDNLTQPAYAPNVLPQPKSLADALDMRVDPVSTAPMIRSGKVDPAVAAKMSRAKDGKVSETIVQQNGSDDLSVSEVTDLDYDDVDVSVYAAKSTLPSLASAAAPVTSINGGGKKSFLATIMERVAAPSDFESSEVSSQSTGEQDQVLSPAVLPQPNSLAAALSMRINPVSTAAPIQEIRSPLPPPPEPDDVDNSESQYDADFVTNQPGVPFSLMTVSPALKSLDQNQGKEGSESKRLLESMSVEVAGMRSELKEAVDDLVSTKAGLELLKEEAALAPKLEAFELLQLETGKRMVTEEDRAKAAEEALRLDLSKAQEQITVMSESISTSKSENDARLAPLEAAATKLSDGLDQVQKSVFEKVERHSSDQLEPVRGQLDELKETIASLGEELEANKKMQETRTSELAEQESSEGKTALREQEERIEKKLAVLSQQYSEGLDTFVAKVFQSSQWAGAEGKLAKALSEIQESRALLDKEHEEVQALKKAVDDHFAKLQDCDDSATSFLSDFSEKGEGQTSEVLKSIQMRMRQERLRQKALRKQLKARAFHVDSLAQPQVPPKQASEEQPFDEDEKASKSLSIPSREPPVESPGVAEMMPIQEDDVIKEVAVTNAPDDVAKDSARTVEAVADDQSEKVSALSTDGTPEQLIEEAPRAAQASPAASDDTPDARCVEASVLSPEEEVAPRAKRDRRGGRRHCSQE